jgi:hypothetical protein
LGARMLRFISYAELSLLLLAAPVAWAQFGMPTPTPTSTPTVNPFGPPPATPTFTNTENPFATPTFTNTYNPFATDTPTIGSPTATFTNTNTFTFTPTGTLTPTATFTPTWTNTPSISRARLVLLPTAYSNAWDRWDGFDWDIDFSYYIGSLISRDFTQPGGIDSLEETSLALLTSDWKYSWLNDEGDRPGMASGLLFSLMAQVGSGGNSNTGTAGSSTGFNAGSTMGGVYTVMSKMIARNTAVHMGYIYGLQGFSNSLGSSFITYNYSALLPFLTSHLSTIQGESPPNVFYAGFNTRFLDRNWKFEVWKPFPMDEHPILFNTQIDGLPLAFNLGYERWDQGFAVLGYVNIQITIFPQTPSY